MRRERNITLSTFIPEKHREENSNSSNILPNDYMQEINDFGVYGKGYKILSKMGRESGESIGDTSKGKLTPIKISEYNKCKGIGYQNTSDDSQIYDDDTSEDDVSVIDISSEDEIEEILYFDIS